MLAVVPRPVGQPKTTAIDGGGAGRVWYVILTVWVNVTSLLASVDHSICWIESGFFLLLQKLWIGNGDLGNKSYTITSPVKEEQTKFVTIKRIFSDSGVPFTNLWHFTHKASVMSIHSEVNAHSADWLMGVYVNELAPHHERSPQGQCVQQCRTILENTLTTSFHGMH